MKRTSLLRFTPLAMGLVLFAGCSEERTLEPSEPARSDAGETIVPDAGEPDPPDAGAPDSGAAADDDRVRVDLGTVQTGANGESEVLTFELPADAMSFMLVAHGPDDVYSIVKLLSGPSGVLVSDDKTNVTRLEEFLLGPFAAQFKSPNRVVQDKGPAAASFPNNPGVTVSAGTYSMVISALRISGQQGTPYQGPVQVELHFRKRVLTAGRLDLSLYFTGAGDITAATAPTEPLIQEALGTLATIYSQANIELGDVAYYDIDASFRTIDGIDGSGDKLERMFALSTEAGPGLRFFFVDRFEGGFPGAMVAGISGGLPGPPLRPGSVNSGVAVALTTANGDSGVLAHVMAHEGGHWLGLFHTSEITGTEDQMPDTPGGQQGQNHLMYPAVGGGTMVSSGQAAVMLRHIETVAR